MARVCQVSPATVAHWIDQGLLKGHKTPTGRRRVEAKELAKFLHAREMAVPPDLREALGRDAIVVVDDDRAYLQALAKTIEKSELGVEVVKAATGVDALLEIGRVRPSVIVLDFSLPDLNGLQVIERLLEPDRAAARAGAPAGRRGRGRDGWGAGRGGAAAARRGREDDPEQDRGGRPGDRGDPPGLRAAEGGVRTRNSFAGAVTSRRRDAWIKDTLGKIGGKRGPRESFPERSQADS